MIRSLLIICTVNFVNSFSIAQNNPANSSPPQIPAPAAPLPPNGILPGSTLPSVVTPPVATPPSLPPNAITETKSRPSGLGDQPAGSEDFKRDPFRLPEYILNRLKVVPVVDAGRIDDMVEPLRRWPLSSYSLIGIIWDVKNPKALVLDFQKKVHVVRIRDKIANRGGVITSIGEGSMTVMQEKLPQVLRLKK